MQTSGTVLRQTQLLHTVLCVLPGPAHGCSISTIKPNWEVRLLWTGRACQYTTLIFQRVCWGIFTFVMKPILFSCKQHSRKPSSLAMFKMTLKNHSMLVAEEGLRASPSPPEDCKKSLLLSLLTHLLAQESH